MLETLAFLLAAAAVTVPLTRRAGFGSVLGYLIAGLAIGPSGLRLVTDVEQIAHVSELGVVMLLFLIGLELRPARLWVMRRAVFAMGGAQVVLTAGLLTWLAHLAGLGWAGAAVVGLGLAMSSTAIVLPMLGERQLLATRAGRDSFAVLLFQDLAFIPLAAMVPLLGAGMGGMPDALPWREVAVGLGGIGAILVIGRFGLGPAFRAIGGARAPELFVLLALLTVAGAAALAHAAGLSASLGAFRAGVLLSDSDYRHELQADIEPFEGLLLGFFFISVGMSADLGLLLAQPGWIAAAVAAVVLAKAALGVGLALAFRLKLADALRFGLALPQGSEFSFVLFASAVAVGALAADQARAATLVVALSMVATPLIFAASERFLIPRLKKPVAENFDPIHNDGAEVILLGFGRVGQIVARVLRMNGIKFTALERDPAQLEAVRRFGNKAYYGDPARPDLLRAAGAETAKLLVIAMDDMEEVLRVVDIVRRTFPDLPILARARNRRHAHLLMDRKVEGLVRDTFHSSLKLAEMTLTQLGMDAARAGRVVELFAAHDEKALADTHAYYSDEKQLLQNVSQWGRELEGILEADREKT